MTRFWQKNSAPLLLLTLLLGLAPACTDMDKTLGEDFIPDEQQQQVALLDATDFCSLKTVRPDDSLCTSSYPYGTFSYGALGVVNDERLGRTQAGFAVTLTPYAGYGYDLGDTVTGYDSVYLRLNLASSAFGSATAGMTVQVYELTQKLQDSLPYYGVRDFGRTRGFNIETLVDTTENLVLGSGALAYDSSVVYLRLSDKLLPKLWNMGSADTFFAGFKGLYVTVKNEGDGCIKYAHVVSSSSSGVSNSVLLAYYHTTDSTTATFPYTVGGQSFNYYQHDYKALDRDSTTLYLQGLYGAAVQLTFDTAKVNRWVAGRNIAVNRAELILPVQDSTDYTTINARYATAMTAMAKLAGGRYSTAADAYYTTFDGSLNRSQMHYAVNLTNALHRALPKLVNSQAVAGTNTPVLLMPADDSSPARSIFIANQPKGRRPQLKVWYGVIK